MGRGCAGCWGLCARFGGRVDREDGGRLTGRSGFAESRIETRPVRAGITFTVGVSLWHVIAVVSVDVEEWIG